jgi:hypothetical protein
MSLAAPVLPPPLLEGDSLTSEEFIRRWELIPDLKHAELIDGIVYMPSPVSAGHGDIQSTLNGWLNVYAMATPGCRPGLEATWLMVLGMCLSRTSPCGFSPSTAASRQ